MCYFYHGENEKIHHIVEQADHLVEASYANRILFKMAQCDHINIFYIFSKSKGYTIKLSPRFIKVTLLGDH